MDDVLCTKCRRYLTEEEKFCDIGQLACFVCREDFIDSAHVYDCTSCSLRLLNYIKECIICKTLKLNKELLNPTNCKLHSYCENCINNRENIIIYRLVRDQQSVSLENNCSDCIKYFNRFSKISSIPNCSFCGMISERSISCKKHEFCRICRDSLINNKFFQRIDRITYCSSCQNDFECLTIQSMPRSISKEMVPSESFEIPSQSVIEFMEPDRAAFSIEELSNSPNEIQCFSCEHQQTITFTGSCGHPYCDFCVNYVILRPQIYSFFNKIRNRETLESRMKYYCKCRAEQISNFPIIKLISRCKEVATKYTSQEIGKYYEFYKTISNHSEILVRYIHYLEGAECIFYVCQNCRYPGVFVGNKQYCPMCQCWANS